jgi:hypothetical protein
MWLPSYMELCMPWCQAPDNVRYTSVLKYEKYLKYKKYINIFTNIESICTETVADFMHYDHTQKILS